MKQLTRYLNGLHVVGLPKALAEKEAARFRQLMGGIDPHFALINAHFPKFDRALEASSPLQLSGRLANRKNANRYQQAAVYFVWMVPELALQMCRTCEDVEGSPLLLPHKIILDQLGVSDADKNWLSAEDGLHHLFQVMGMTRLMEGDFFDPDRLWRYATDWPYALAGLRKLVQQLQQWSTLDEAEQLQCHELFWAVSLCLLSKAPVVDEVMLQSEWGLTPTTALAFRQAYYAQMGLPEGLFTPPHSFVKGSNATHRVESRSRSACSEALLAEWNQDDSLTRAHLSAALLAAIPAHQTDAASGGETESTPYVSLSLSAILARVSQLPERLTPFVLGETGADRLKISPQSCHLRAWPIASETSAVSSPLLSCASDALLAEALAWSASYSQHQSRLALWARWVYEVCVQLEPFSTALSQHGLLTAPRQQALAALKGVLLAFEQAPMVTDAAALTDALQQCQRLLSPMIAGIEGVAVLEESEGRLKILDDLRVILDHFGQALIKLMFSLEAEARVHAWEVLMAADQPALPVMLPEWVSPALVADLGALRGRLAERSAEQALMLFPVLAQEVDTARQHILSAHARREALVDETLATLHSLLFGLVSRVGSPPNRAECAETECLAPPPEVSHERVTPHTQKQFDALKKQLHDRDRELQKQQKELTEKRIEAARLKQECQRLEKAQVGPLYLPGGQTMSALAEGLVRTMPDSQPRLSLILKAAAQFCHGQVEVLDSAYKSAQAYQRVEYSPTEVMDKLLRLCLDYLPRFILGGDNKAREVFGQIYSAKESDSVMNDVRMRSQREFKVKGQPKLFLKHLRLNSYLRLYFEVDQAREKIIIAYLGEHLDCAITA